MREIKFRAWDKKNKVMLSHDKLFRLDCSNEYPFLALIKGYYANCIDALDIELMQFTGLKNKNGMEIYEYDLLEAYWPDGKLREKTTVRWMEKGQWNISQERLISRGHIITGNIYEVQS